MYTINGGRFYGAFTSEGMLERLMKDLGVKSLEGYVGAAHSRLIRIALRGIARVTAMHTGVMAGREMVWVKITLK